MKIYVDVDNTVFKTNGNDYVNSVPIPENITKINKLYDEGNTIIYWTARGKSRGLNFFMLTLDQLVKAGCKFHSLDAEHKPRYDLLICDKTKRIEEI